MVQIQKILVANHLMLLDKNAKYFTDVVCDYEEGLIESSLLVSTILSIFKVMCPLVQILSQVIFKRWMSKLLVLVFLCIICVL